ncbi:unnamed protein product [Prunus brigantina]
MLNYLHRNLPLRALDMFSKQLQLHLSHNIDEVTVTLAIKACQGDPKPGCQIHGFLEYYSFGVSNKENTNLRIGEHLFANPSQGQKAALTSKLTALHEVICSKGSIEKIT